MGAAAYFLAYLGGLGAAPFLPWKPVFAFLPFFFALIWLLVRKKGRFPAFVPLFGFLASLAFAQYHLHLAPPPDSLAGFAGSSESLMIDGTAAALGVRSTDKSFLDIDVSTVGSSGTAARTTGRVRIYLDDVLPAVHVGDRVRLHTRLRRPGSFGTPGEFDFARYLARRMIFVTGFVRDAGSVAVFPREHGLSMTALVQRQWQKVAHLIERAAAPPLSGLTQALLIGEKGAITPEQRQVLSRSGLAHLFSISGLHLGLVGWFAYLVLRELWRRSDRLLRIGPPQRYLPLMLLPALFVYLLFTGDALPTRRAFMMAGAAAFLPLFGRRVRPLNLLFALGAIVLVCDPLALYEPSFQLSYAGVLGIMLFAAPLLPGLSRYPEPVRWVLGLVAVTFAATVATAPLVIMNFHQLSTAGLAANLAATPVICMFALPLGLVGLFFSFFQPDWAVSLFSLCAALLELMYNLAKWLTDLPFLGGWVLFPEPIQVAGSAILAMLILMSRSLKTKIYKCCLLFTGALVLLFLPAATGSGTALTVLSVGQGDSAVISLDGARHFLVDGGGLYSESFDVGERLVAPALGRLGIRRLDAVILTHDHPDHRKGLLYILDNFPVRRFISPHDPEILDAGLREILLTRRIPVHVAAPGWNAVPATNGRLQVYSLADKEAEMNDQSLVLYLAHAAGGALLTGDLEKLGVRSLLATPAPGPVSLLKLPHHGSAGAAPELLCDQLAVRQACVSVGRSNVYGLPAARVLRELKQREIPLWRTDFHGTLRFTPTESGWEVARWQRGRFRNVSGPVFAKNSTIGYPEDDESSQYSNR